MSFAQIDITFQKRFGLDLHAWHPFASEMKYLNAFARHLSEVTCVGFIPTVSYLCSTAHFPLFMKQFMIISFISFNNKTVASQTALCNKMPPWEASQIHIFQLHALPQCCIVK